MKIEGLRYVMLGSSDLERSVRFYRDQLGLAVQHRREEFAYFDCGNATLVLTTLLRGRLRDDCAVPKRSRARCSERPCCLRGTLARGVAFIKPPGQVNEELWATNCKDPDGHLVSICGAQ